jgi:uncharacterized protein
LTKAIKIECGNIELDGLFKYISGEKTAIVTHPHPLYGGNMENPVVEAITEELIKKGYSTLRFNFRQVKMQGDDEDSIKDLEAVFDFVKTRGIKTSPLLAGYSYGSWVNTLAVSKGLQIADSIMISPPIAFLDYKKINSLPGPGLVVTGSDDEIAPPKLVEKNSAEWNSDFTLKIIKGCDHFYGGYLQELKKTISDYLTE